MDPINQLTNQVHSLEKKIDEMMISIRVIKRVFIWMLIATVVAFVLPLIGLAVVIPQFIDNYTSALNF